jgi:hypothetical protein
VPGGITGPPCYLGHKHKHFVLHARLDARLMTLVKEIIVVKSKEVKTGCNMTESSKVGYGPKRAFIASDEGNE